MKSLLLATALLTLAACNSHHKMPRLNWTLEVTDSAGNLIENLPVQMDEMTLGLPYHPYTIKVGLPELVKNATGSGEDVKRSFRVTPTQVGEGIALEVRCDLDKKSGEGVASFSTIKVRLTCSAVEEK